MPLEIIDRQIHSLINTGYAHPNKKFMVTKIGTGLAGYTDDQIASLFFRQTLPENLLLPGAWLLSHQCIQEYRVIIAGGRDFNNYDLLTARCDHILSSTNRVINIVSGTAPGTDSLAIKYYKKKKKEEPHRWKLTKFPADWTKYGRPAGMLRNSAMGWYATHLIAFWDGQSRGTNNMLSIGKRERLHSRVVRYKLPPTIIQESHYTPLKHL